MTSPPPSPPPVVSTTHVPTASPTASTTASAILSFFSSPITLLLIGVLVVLIILLIVVRRASASRGFMSFNFKDADAVFILKTEKTNNVIIVPGKQIATGLFQGVYNNDVYLIAVDGNTVPGILKNANNKPVYFAVGGKTMFVSMNLQSLAETALATTLSDKSFSELIAEILNGTSQISGKIPIGNMYYLAVTVNVDKLLEDEMIDFKISSADAVVNALTSVTKEVVRLKELELQREKLKMLSTRGKYWFIIVIVTISLMMGVVMMYLMNGGFKLFP